MENEDFFKLCDKKGILVMVGWMCCDAFEREERLQRFAKDFSLDEMMLVSIVEKHVTGIW